MQLAVQVTDVFLSRVLQLLAGRRLCLSSLGLDFYPGTEARRLYSLNKAAEVIVAYVQQSWAGCQMVAFMVPYAEEAMLWSAVQIALAARNASAAQVEAADRIVHIKDGANMKEHVMREFYLRFFTYAGWPFRVAGVDGETDTPSPLYPDQYPFPYRKMLIKN